MIITVISPIPETGVNTCRIVSMMVIVKMVSFEANKFSLQFYLFAVLSFNGISQNQTHQSPTHQTQVQEWVWEAKGQINSE